MLNFLSGLIFLLGFLPYTWAVINHEAIPSPVTWAIWASVDTLALVAMRKEKAAVGQLIGATVGAWIVFCLALFYGENAMGVVEWVSIGGAAIGIIAWKITNNPLMAIICSQATVIIGAIPTVMAAYENPGQENAIAWSMWTISCIFTLFTIKKWNLANALQPLNFMAVDGVIALLVVVRPLWM